MRMNQDERRFDFHGLGAALKRAREEKGWTQAYVAELVDRDSRTIMNIENKGQYPSFDLFVKLITMFDVSVDQFIHAVLAPGAHSQFGSGKNTQFEPEQRANPFENVFSKTAVFPPPAIAETDL